jgi:preprotein translocase subunit SecD
VNVVLLEALLKPGLLEFVDFSNIASGSIPEGACILTTEQVRVAEARLFEGETPNAYVDYTCADGSPVMLNAGQPFTTIMTGAGIADAVAQAYGQGGSRFIVNFVLKDGGEVENFTDFVANNPNQPMAIVLDGRLLSAPVIQASLSEAARAGTIDGGVITGNFTQDEARVLAAQIKYGIFPLPLQIISVDG